MFSPPVLGQAAYELPGIVVWGTHASADSAVPRPASQDTTVYGRAVATSADIAIPERAQATDALKRRFLRCGDDMTLPCGSCY